MKQAIPVSPYHLPSRSLHLCLPRNWFQKTEVWLSWKYKLPVNKSRFCQWLMFSICLIKDFKVLRAPVGKLEFTPNLICHLWKFRLLGHLWLCALPLELFLPLTCLELGTKTSLSQYQVLMCKKLVLWFYCLHHYVVSHCALSQRLGGY